MADQVLMPAGFPWACWKWILKEFWVYLFFIVILTLSYCVGGADDMN